MSRRSGSGEPVVGERFAGRYDILRPLGRGGMGAVFAAHDTILDEAVALKILTATADVEEAAIRRFRREVLLARRVTHPNIVRVHDIGEADGLLYMTMALVEGQTMRGLLLRDGPQPASRALELFAELVGAVAAVHAAGIIHRDLKPTNVLLDRRGQVLLADFGIARTTAHDLELTQPGAVVGTIRYMAPEQLRRGDDVDARADVYALGLLLNELLTCEVPAPGSGLASDLSAVEGAAALVAGIERLLERCLAPDPSARPRSAAALLCEIEALRDASATGLLPPPTDDRATAIRPTPPDAWAPPPSPIAAPTTADLRDLAVLPFQYFGPADDRYLGQTIAEELVDLLARLKGIKVLGTGTTSGFAERRDPRAIGEALDVLWVIDGTIQRAGERARTTVRMFDARSGAQLWSECVTGTISDTFAFQSSVARTVAEHVRAELTTLSSRDNAPPEAIERYLAARRDLIRFDDLQRGHDAYRALREAVDLAPDFTPAVAALALTSVRAWFTAMSRDDGEAWEAEADARVADALARAPEIPEAQLAAGVLALQRCDFAGAVRALAEVLSIAPTHGEAHRYLAMLEMEAGLEEPAKTRFRLVADVERTTSFPLTQLARWHALDGDLERDEQLFADAARRSPTPSMGVVLMRLRDAVWRRAPPPKLSPSEEIWLARAPWPLPRLFTAALAGELTVDALLAAEAEVLTMGQSPRATATVHQFTTELLLYLGDVDAAIEHLIRCEAIGLIDVSWLDRCPLLEPLRGHSAFHSVGRRVRARALAAFAAAPTLHTPLA